MSWEARMAAQRAAIEEAQKKRDADQKQRRDERITKENAANAARAAAEEAELSQRKDTPAGQEIQRFIQSQEFKDAMSAIMRNAQPLLFDKLLGRSRNANHPDFVLETSEMPFQKEYFFSVSIKWAYKPSDPAWKCQLFRAFISTSGDHRIKCGIFEGPYTPEPDGPHTDPYHRYDSIEDFLNSIATSIHSNRFAGRYREIRREYGFY